MATWTEPRSSLVVFGVWVLDGCVGILEGGDGLGAGQRLGHKSIGEECTPQLFILVILYFSTTQHAIHDAITLTLTKPVWYFWYEASRTVAQCENDK